MPVDRSRLNSVGDLVVTQPAALRALINPVTRRLFDLVRRLGPATSARLAAEIGEDEEATRVRLAAMESADLIDVDEGEPALWSTPARGLYFEIPEHGDEAQQVARELSSAMFADASELPARWAGETEPQLPVDWVRAAGLFNARVALTADELRGLQEDLERLLEPFNVRGSDERPADAVTVMILAFFMPESAGPR